MLINREEIGLMKKEYRYVYNVIMHWRLETERGNYGMLAF